MMSKDQVNKAFGASVAIRRKQLGHTQQNLASLTGISRASIANIERGQQNVALHHIYSIAEALEISKVSDLLPPLNSSSNMGEETMIRSRIEGSVTPRGQAQINELLNNALKQGEQKRGLG